MTTFLMLALVMFPMAPDGSLKAGVSTVSINPLEQNIATQLGGYGAREGKPAIGTHDTIHAKTILFEWKGKKSALVTLDVCSLPINLVEESLAKANLPDLTTTNVLMCASHSHAGLEGASLDRRNIANNPYIGIFSEETLAFVVERLAAGLRQANDALQPVRAGAIAAKLPEMNRNRRGDPYNDEDLTVLRIDRLDSSPYAIIVNYTAHGTIMTENEMLVSGCWSGNMQRTVEAILGQNCTCFYTNGAEGDISPASQQGGSSWEKAEDYGRRVGIRAAGLAAVIQTTAVEQFVVKGEWMTLPPKKPAPDFIKIAGDEYHVTEEQLNQILPVMFPDKAPVYSLRIDTFQMATFPGEPLCQIGLAVKGALRKEGIQHPCVVSLTSDSIGYILTAEEYRQSGYETTASFYGETLGDLMTDKVTDLAIRTTRE